MRRILTVVAVALVMAALLLAMAMPAFAAKPFEIGSAVSVQNVDPEEAESPRDGLNYGLCTKDRESEIAPGNGRATAAWNPSFHGGGEDAGSFRCSKT